MTEKDVPTTLEDRIAALETRLSSFNLADASAFSAGDCTNGCTSSCTNGCTNGCTGSCVTDLPQIAEASQTGGGG
jgi:hypothetical protein